MGGRITILMMAAAISFSSAAGANLYSISFTSGSHSGSAILSTTGDASTGFSLVTGLGGTFDGSPMTLLAPGTFYNDNLFTLVSPYFDMGGLGFSVGSAEYSLIVPSDNNDYLCVPDTGGALCTGATVTAHVYDPRGVPEPSTWAMLLIGFAMMGLYRRVSRETWRQSSNESGHCTGRTATEPSVI